MYVSSMKIGARIGAVSSPMKLVGLSPKARAYAFVIREYPWEQECSPSIRLACL